MIRKHTINCCRTRFSSILFFSSSATLLKGAQSGPGSFFITLKQDIRLSSTRLSSTLILIVQSFCISKVRGQAKAHLSPSHRPHHCNPSHFSHPLRTSSHRHCMTASMVHLLPLWRGGSNITQQSDQESLQQFRRVIVSFHRYLTPNILPCDIISKFTPTSSST